MVGALQASNRTQVTACHQIPGRSPNTTTRTHLGCSASTLTKPTNRLGAEKSAHDARKMTLTDTQGINAALKDELSDRTEWLCSAISTICRLNKRLLAKKYHGAQLARHLLQTVLTTRAQSRAQDEANKLAADVMGAQILGDR